MVQGQSRTSRISPPIKEDEAKGDNMEKGQGNNLNDISSSITLFSWVIKYFPVGIYEMLYYEKSAH